MYATGHVNNVMYNRYAEAGRIGWFHNFANILDPAHKREWSQLWTPVGDGLILRSIRTDFKFVRFSFLTE
jgi:acyl-CoA thioesterase FadM